MENEENRGLIDKTASKDHFVTFCQLSSNLSHYFLSLTLSLSVLET